MTAKELKKRFTEIYGGNESDVRVFSAAGRINLIGEHIDYCGGPVLPAALNLCTLVAARKTSGKTVRMAATTIDLTAELDIEKLDSYRDLKWGEYQAGVAYILAAEGYTITPCDLLYDTTVPFGSGLSSSASIEVATALMFSTFSGESGGKTGTLKELSVLSQRAECEYAGVSCGIMDQFASAMGKKGHAILLDCNTLDYEYIPLVLDGYETVIINSNKKRSLQESKYNERRAECERALSLLQNAGVKAECLAGVTETDFEKHKDVLPGKVKDRAEHVVRECARVKKFAAALSSGDIETAGKILNEGHYSLRDLYEVTGKELDALTDAARNHAGCIGSRMTGAGFGGCTVSLVKKDAVESFIKDVSEKYNKATGLKAECYTTSVEDGAFEVKS